MFIYFYYCSLITQMRLPCLLMPLSPVFWRDIFWSYQYCVPFRLSSRPLLSSLHTPHSTTWSSIVLNISTWFWVNILCMTENIVSPSASLMWWKWSGFNWPWSGEIELGPPQTTLPLTINLRRCHQPSWCGVRCTSVILINIIWLRPPPVETSHQNCKIFELLNFDVDIFRKPPIFYTQKIPLINLIMEEWEGGSKMGRCWVSEIE